MVEIQNGYLLIGLVALSGVVYALLVRPIHQRYQSVLDRLLGKEIARQLYQSLHTGFTYDNRYHPDDRQSQLILSAAREEFQRLQNNANTIVKGQ